LVNQPHLIIVYKTALGCGDQGAIFRIQSPCSVYLFGDISLALLYMGLNLSAHSKLSEAYIIRVISLQFDSHIHPIIRKVFSVL